MKLIHRTAWFGLVLVVLSIFLISADTTDSRPGQTSDWAETYRFAHQLLSRGDYARARVLFEESFLVVPGFLKDNTLFFLAQTRLNAGDTPAAIPIYLAIIRDYSEGSFAVPALLRLVNLGVKDPVMYKVGKDRVSSRLLREQPGLLKYMCELESVLSPGEDTFRSRYLDGKDPVLAMKLYETWIARADSSGRRDLFRKLIMKGETDLEERYREVYAVDNADSLYLSAIAGYHTGRYRFAIPALEKSYRMSPARRDELAFYLYRANRSLGRAKRRDYWHDVLLRDHRGSYYTDRLLYASFKKWKNRGDWTRALAAVSRLVRSGRVEQRKDYIFERGILHLAAGKKSLAVADFSRISDEARGIFFLAKTGVRRPYQGKFPANDYYVMKAAAEGLIEPTDLDYSETSFKESLPEEALFLEKEGLDADAFYYYRYGRDVLRRTSPLTLIRGLRQAGKFHLSQEEAEIFYRSGKHPDGFCREGWEALFPVFYRETVRTVSARYNVDYLLSLSVMREESHFDPEIVSSAGAMGLFQLMPRTAREVMSQLAWDLRGNMVWQPEKNIEMGVYYLGRMLSQADGVQELALAGYNAGYGNVKKWRRRYRTKDIDIFIELIPFDETRRYVKKVMRSYYLYRWLYGRDDYDQQELREG